MRVSKSQQFVRRNGSANFSSTLEVMVNVSNKMRFFARCAHVL